MKQLHLFYSVSLLVSTVALMACAPAHAESSQHAIKGFRFQTCDEKQCVEANAGKAWLSQLDGGFSSDGPTQLIVRSTNGGAVLQEFNGTEASYSPRVQVITLDREDGSAVFISLKDGSIRFFGGTTSGSLTPSQSGGQK